MSAPVPAGRPFPPDLSQDWVRDLKRLTPAQREAVLRGLAMSYGQRAACMVRKGLR